MRKLWLDDLRWSTVLLVAAYHVCYLFNGAGIFGGIPGAPSIPFFDALAGLVYPWSMVLLFTAAGMSARYSLEGRSPGSSCGSGRTSCWCPPHWVCSRCTGSRAI